MYHLFVEVFTEYAVSIMFLLLRFFTRWWMVGFQGFDLGDAFAGAATLFYSLETAGIYLLLSLGNNVGLDKKTALEVPNRDIPHLVLGSKIAFMNWLWYITFIWCLKGVLLALYFKLGRDITRQEILVKCSSVFCACTYIGCLLTHVLICTPPWKGWQIRPYPGDNCTVRRPDYIVIGVLNVLSDVSILVIPLPILWTVQIPLTRKLAIGVIFSLGYFVIITTILRSYYSLLSLDTLPIAIGWASRETFCATVAVCAPGIKPLFSRSHWLRTSKPKPESFQGIEANAYPESSTSKPHCVNHKVKSVRSRLHLLTWRRHSTTATHVMSALGDVTKPSVPTISKETHIELNEWVWRQHGRIRRKTWSRESNGTVGLEADPCKDFVIIVNEAVVPTGVIGRAL